VTLHDVWISCKILICFSKNRQSATEKGRRNDKVTKGGCELTDLKEHGRMGIK